VHRIAQCWGSTEREQELPLQVEVEEEGVRHSTRTHRGLQGLPLPRPFSSAVDQLA
jgi:adenylyl- and sulfurtransferase ThiI